jgi:hypothetical protein
VVAFELALQSVGFLAHAHVRGLPDEHLSLFDERWPRAAGEPLDGSIQFDIAADVIGLPRDARSAATVMWLGPDEAVVHATSAELTVRFRGRTMEGTGALHAPHTRTAMESAFRAVAALALARRGIAILHASAVALGAIGVVFMGESEAGKTTTARRLGREGFRRLADDMIAIDLTRPSPTLHPLAFDRAAANAMRTQYAGPAVACLGGALVRKGASKPALLPMNGPAAVRAWSEARIALPSPPGRERALLDEFEHLCSLPLAAFDVPPRGPIRAIFEGFLERLAASGNPMGRGHERLDAGAIYGKDTAVQPTPDVAKPAKNPQIRRPANVAWRVIDGSAVLVIPSSPNVQTLNAVGTRVWELADGRPLSDIVDIVVNEFEVTRTQALVDVQAFVRELAGKGLLQLSESAI